MPKRLSKPIGTKRPRDVSQWAHQIVQESTTEPPKPEITKAEISRVMAEMGRRGGRKGGKRRLLTMTPEQRSQVALKAAKVRWAKRKQDH